MAASPADVCNHRITHDRDQRHDLPPADGRNRAGAGAVDPDVNSATAAPPPAAWYSGAVDRRLHPRRPLSSVALAGARASWHTAARWLACGLAALSALLVAVEPHRVCDRWGACEASDWGPSHTLLQDLGAMPLVLLALVIGLQLMGKQASFLLRVFTVVGAATTMIFILGTMAFAHFLSSTEGGDGAVLVALLTFACCVFQMVMEPVLAIGQRRALEASEPVFPRAAVVEQ